jgi:hypothetical protein
VIAPITEPSGLGGIRLLPLLGRLAIDLTQINFRIPTSAIFAFVFHPFPPRFTKKRETGDASRLVRLRYTASIASATKGIDGKTSSRCAITKKTGI